MKSEWKVIEAIAPDAMATIQQRFQIMQTIDRMGPIGRRGLADKIPLTERSLRTEAEYLKKFGLLDISKSGMTLSERGQQVYQQMAAMVQEFSYATSEETRLAQYLNIERCVIVSGNSSHDEKNLRLYGKVVSDILNYRLLQKENIVAVMGGKTMSVVASHMTELETDNRHNIFVPARGSVGEKGHIQANFVSETMAKETGGSYRTLYVPEQVSPKTYEPLLQEPSVQQVLTLIHQPDCILHSIGESMTMAERRNMPKGVMDLLVKQHAVAESFGCFFDKEGEIIYKVPRIGLQLKDLIHVPIVLAIAGGSDKAKAISAYMKNAPSQTWLVTDEGAAEMILSRVTY